MVRPATNRQLLCEGLVQPLYLAHGWWKVSNSSSSSSFGWWWSDKRLKWPNCETIQLVLCSALLYSICILRVCVCGQTTLWSGSHCIVYCTETERMCLMAELQNNMFQVAAAAFPLLQYVYEDKYVANSVIVVLGGGGKVWLIVRHPICIIS